MKLITKERDDDMKRVLIIEDELILKLLTSNLEQKAMRSTFNGWSRGFRYGFREFIRYDLLDLMPPNRDGMDICR